MIQLEQQQNEEFVVGWVADTNYLYPARWGWINYIHIPYMKQFHVYILITNNEFNRGLFS